MSIKENLERINKIIDKSVENSGREKGCIELLAVSKRKPLEDLLEAYNSGQRLFGENRIQEAELKIPQMPNDAIFHMIGHLQSNKVKKACELFDCIESVDSLKIAKKIDKQCEASGKIMDIYLDVNIAEDVNKTGFKPNEDFPFIVDQISKMSNIRVLGLMCIGAFVDDKDKIRESFDNLKTLSENLRKDNKNIGDKLSMGMSGDFEVAIEAGSTLVRVGSSIFGMRN